MKTPKSANVISRRGVLAAGTAGLGLSAVGIAQAAGGRPVAQGSDAAKGAAQDQDFDYVVIGGGTAGPVLAARLTEDPTVSVLLIEAGSENTYEASEYAAGAFQMWGPETNWGFQSAPQSELGGRQIMQPRGKVIGGSAAINVGSWSRGTRANYESWGLPGWDWDTIVSTYKRIEKTQGTDPEYRGHAGKMSLEDTPAGTKLTEVLHRAAVEAGVGDTDDRNAADPVGFDLWESIFPRGKRHNTEHGYLKDARSRSNLTVLTGAHVDRIDFDEKKAVGVSFRRQGQSSSAKARREILLCAGAINSPHLLMLSGVGPAAHLREHGIEVVADAPAVGSNLADHLRVTVGALSPEGVGETLYANPGDSAQLEQWRSGAYGALTVAENTSAAFVHSTEDAPHPDIELMYSINPPMNFRKSHPGRAGWYMNIGLVQPKSRGSIRLRSANPSDKAIYDPAYLSHPDDLATYTRGIRLALAHVNTAALKPFTDSSTLTLSVDASDEAIEAHIRGTAESIYHPAGSVRMGVDGDETAALDPECRVRGVEGLRVVDASSLPSLISGHTMAPTILIAERVAAMIKAG